MKKSVIFLDLDGVMCLLNDWGTRTKKMLKFKKEFPGSSEDDMPAWIKLDNFDYKATKVLNSILLHYDVEIVISSDWKLFASLEQLQEMFDKYGVVKSPIDVTPTIVKYESKSQFTKSELVDYRVSEIKTWLKDHPEVTHWVAIDDMDLGEKFGPISGNFIGGLSNFVHTPKPTQGIKQSGVKEKIIKFLND
jgi:hypothetical protein